MSSSLSIPKFKVGLTSEEKNLYTQLFKALDPENSGVVTGEKARFTFEKSGLPPTVLGEIWQIADQNNLGFLNQFGFCYAMRLIGYTQSGQHPTPGLGDYPGPLPKFVNLNLPSRQQQQQQQPLQPQSTNSSFMSSQPNANANIPSTTSPQNPIDVISPQDYRKFSQLFIKTVGSPQGQLNGGQAKDIFLKARLPTAVLGQIWSLVDRYNSGSLTIDSFVIAMHLIQGLLSGQIKQLPPFLSESIWQSVKSYSQLQENQPLQNQQQARQVSHSSVNSQSTSIIHPPSRTVTSNDWIVTSKMKQQYDSIFNNLDKEKTGQLNPDQVAQFLMTSKLNQQDLASIWDLSDIQNSGIFTKLEFSIALFLVNKRLENISLPNVIPDSLINSIKELDLQSSSHVTEDSTQQNFPLPKEQPIVQLPARAQSSVNELADIFTPTKPTAPPTTNEVKSLQNRPSSSDLSHGSELPKMRSTLTGSFKPTSTFGQSLLHNQQQSTSNVPSPVKEPTQESLLGEDVKEKSQTRQQPQIDFTSPQKVVDYSALRNVPLPPPPPSSQKKTASFGTEVLTPQNRFSSNNSSKSNNEDLLADPAISGQLSQATSDIANVSNQIKSLATQTTSLHEKKNKADQELNKILKTKLDIENKLKQLRASYENEVKQVAQVDASLSTAKEETEALRSEASIAEAKVNSISTELHDKQIAVENLQKENSSLKEKLGTLNAETVELENQLKAKESETQQLKNQISVKKSQAQVTIVKNEELKNKISELETHHKELQSNLDNAEQERLNLEQEQKDFQQKHLHLQQNEPTKPSPGIKASNIGLGVVAGAGAAIGTAIGTIANAVSLQSDSTEKSDITSNQKQETQQLQEDKTQDASDSKENSGQFIKNVHKLSLNDDSHVNSTTGTSSTITEQEDESETPITSPSNSDFQFPQAGIVGGMVGMPGVLVGVQRTDSLTSSVQNNAALSVRDDNIEEVSDRETIGIIEESGNEAKDDSHENRAPNSGNTEIFDHSISDRQQGDSDKGSSSFEMVNMEEARSPDNTDEFPPIRELDYQESDSEDDNNFDDAVDNLGQTQSTSEKQKLGTDSDFASSGHTNQRQTFDDFDSEFDDLQPAKEDMNATNQIKTSGFEGSTVSNNEDFFGDEFDDLEDAKDDDNNNDEEFDKNNVQVDDFNEFSNNFTNSNAPDFGSGFINSNNNLQENTNDEWEQLFAGFGNANPETESGPTNVNNDSNTISTPQVTRAGDVETDSYAIQELVGMGFDEETARDALKKQNWNLESATNYLLDNA